MSARVVLAGLLRVGGALGLNVLLLAALMHLNRIVPVQAQPETVARLRFAEPLPVQHDPVEPLPERVPETEPVEVSEDVALPEHEIPLPEIEPLALTSVLPAASVPVLVRPVPAPARAAPGRTGAATRSAGAPREDRPRVAESDEVDEPPRELRVHRPEYPSRARRRGIEGSATVRLLIDEEGRVVDVELVDTRGSDEFGEAVLAVAPGWVFRPARDEGRPVRVRALKTVRFRLENGW